jgi:glycosyltransferase involved in cell wall biosynthesis
MRIGVDATCWANQRGYGRFAREIVRAMALAAPHDEFLCFVDSPARAAWPHRLPNVRLVEVSLGESPTTAASSTSSRSLRDMLRLTRAVGAARVEVFFAPTIYSYFPLPPRLPAVVAIHDTIPERFPHLTLPTPKARLFWWAKMRLALWQCGVVLTVSEYAARSIEVTLGVPRSRIRVTTEAPAEAWRPTTPAEQATAAARAGLPAGTAWFAYVGGFNPHKRVDVILASHAAVAQSTTPAPHLVLSGSRSDPYHDDISRLDQIVRDLGTGDLVHWLGWVPDEDLVPLVGGAAALLIPSEVEGFGLPAVEAAACGTPVVATTESPLPELLAGGGYFVAPGDASALTSAMRALLDPAQRSAMGAVALERATALSWERAAEVVLAAIYEAAA